MGGAIGRCLVVWVGGVGGGCDRRRDVRPQGLDASMGEGVNRGLRAVTSRFLELLLIRGPGDNSVTALLLAFLLNPNEDFDIGGRVIKTPCLFCFRSESSTLDVGSLLALLNCFSMISAQQTTNQILVKIC